jgi:hypothetical protein
VRPERRSSVVRRSLMARETNQSTIWEFEGMAVQCFIYKFYLFVFECYVFDGLIGLFYWNTFSLRTRLMFGFYYRIRQSN